MKRLELFSLLLFAILSVAACGGGGGSTGQTPGATTIAISGTLSDTVTAPKLKPGQGAGPMGAITWSNALIEIIDSSGNVVATTTASGSGSFVVNVPPGQDYFVRASIGNLVLKAVAPSSTTNHTVTVDPTSSAIVKVLGQIAGNANIGDSGADVSGSLAAGTVGNTVNSFKNSSLINAIAGAIAADVASNYDPNGSAPSVGSAGTAGDGDAAAIAAAQSDTTRPTLDITTPANPVDGATYVSVNSAIIANFSEAMDPATITTSTFTLSYNPAITGTVTYAANSATFTPDSPLPYDKTFTATITTGVKDVAGNSLAFSYMWTFSTPPILLDAGHDHTLYFDGVKLYAWGKNDSGQLGISSFNDANTPKAVSITNPTDISAGRKHSLAVTTTGAVYAWGENGNGELGVGDTQPRWNPARVCDAYPCSSYFTAIAVAAGDAYSIALKSDGTVWEWGWTMTGLKQAPVQVGGIDTAFAIAAGDRFGLAIIQYGAVRAWGDNSYGQLGNGTTTWSATAVSVASGATLGVVSISAGSGHSLAIVNLVAANSVKSSATHIAGNPLTWGLNSSGQLGLGDYANGTTPSNVTVSATGGITSASCGVWHTIVADGGGNVFTWGNNSSGQLGDGTTNNSYSQKNVAGLTGITHVSAGRMHSVAVKDDGTVWTWGNSSFGQLGIGSSSGDFSTPQQVTFN